MAESESAAWSKYAAAFVSGHIKAYQSLGTFTTGDKLVLAENAGEFAGFMLDQRAKWFDSSGNRTRERQLP